MVRLEIGKKRLAENKPRWRLARDFAGDIVGDLAEDLAGDSSETS
jgi:hypothetical protein